MSFVYDGDEIPTANKVDATAMVGEPEENLTADETNQMLTALEDLKEAVLEGRYLGFLETDNTSAPVSEAGAARLRFNGTELQVSYDGGAYESLGGGLTAEELAAGPVEVGRLDITGDGEYESARIIKMGDVELANRSGGGLTLSAPDSAAEPPAYFSVTGVVLGKTLGMVPQDLSSVPAGDRAFELAVDVMTMSLNWSNGSDWVDLSTGGGGGGDSGTVEDTLTITSSATPGLDVTLSNYGDGQLDIGAQTLIVTANLVGMAARVDFGGSVGISNQNNADAGDHSAGVCTMPVDVMPAGRAFIPSGASSVSVEGVLCDPQDIVLCTLQTNDATFGAPRVVVGSNEFTIHGSAAATDDTLVGFLIIRQPSDGV